jgi:hypothetical protein
MRFFNQAQASTSTRPRSISTTSSSSSSASPQPEVQSSASSHPINSPSHLQHTSTSHQQPSSRLPISPAGSPPDHRSATRNQATLNGEEANSPESNHKPNLAYAAFPKSLHAELEEYDRRASQADPIHYFSSNRHAEYVCRECLVPLVSVFFLCIVMCLSLRRVVWQALQDEVVSKAFSGSLGQA